MLKNKNKNKLCCNGTNCSKLTHQPVPSHCLSATTQSKQHSFPGYLPWAVGLFWDSLLQKLMIKKWGWGREEFSELEKGSLYLILWAKLHQNVLLIFCSWFWGMQIQASGLLDSFAKRPSSGEIPPGMSHFSMYTACSLVLDLHCTQYAVYTLLRLLDLHCTWYAVFLAETTGSTQ